MDDDVASDMRRREELELIKAFLGIADPSKRRRILEFAERLAADAGSEEGLAFASTAPSLVDLSKDVPARTE